MLSPLSPVLWTFGYVLLVYFSGTSCDRRPLSTSVLAFSRRSLDLSLHFLSRPLELCHWVVRSTSRVQVVGAKNSPGCASACCALDLRPSSFNRSCPNVGPYVRKLCLVSIIVSPRGLCNLSYKSFHSDVTNSGLKSMY